MAPIKLGLIGLSAGGSWASRAHLPYFSKTDKYEIVALLNRSVESGKKAAENYNLSGVACYDKIDALLKDSNVDLIALSVKVPDHYEIAKPALEAGKDIFIEWPLAANLKQAEELTTLAKSHKVKNLCGLQARQDPSILKARELVLNGNLGDILGTTMTGHGGLFGPQATPYFEYMFPLENGANLVTIPFGHAVDALCYVLGEFKDLQATLANNRPKIDVVDDAGKHLRTVDKTSHDHLALTGTLQRGGIATVVYQPATSLTGKNFYWEINGTKGSLVLEGSSGHIQMFHPTIKFVSTEKNAKLKEIEVEAPSEFSYNVGQAWDAFAEKGEGTVTTFEDALLRHKMIEAIYRSDEKGTRESYL
ncbi:hypothetical protein PV11_05896 [Exophiala sideris]|uniref:Gfo/Idh/MocA-like oxidoreductase N-terminal domain-containing protein n=1 Tax=Exophiala sideris TaxID=1016849 RepID=A0A0D1X7U8_9EURO|nr:hypothetical protein PV11_05896 [Exophiala sideris]